MAAYSPIQDGFRLEAEWFETAATLYAGLDGFLAYMAGAVFLTGGALASGGSLRLVRSAGVGPAKVQAWLVPAVVTELYAATLTLLPGLRDEVLLGEADFAAVTTIGFDQAAGLATLLALTSSPGWNHRLGITIKTDAVTPLQFVASEAGADGPLLTLTEAGAAVSTRPVRHGSFSRLTGSPSLIRRSNRHPRRR